MKKVQILIILLLINECVSHGQEPEPAPADKAVVYFIRISDLGMVINFSYFDSATLISKFSGKGYFRYECEPGTHLFWARSENKDFVEADVEAGKIYFIEAMPGMGLIKSTVHLLPVDPTNSKKIEKIRKLFKKLYPATLTPRQLQDENLKASEIVETGLKKYQEEKQKGLKIIRLEKTMYYIKN